MNHKFEEGQWVIDTRKEIAPTVVAHLESNVVTLYVLEDETGDYYITKEDNLIPYDKHYFDE